MEIEIKLLGLGIITSFAYLFAAIYSNTLAHIIANYIAKQF